MKKKLHEKNKQKNKQNEKGRAFPWKGTKKYGQKLRDHNKKFKWSQT